ncbi:hypothetical protein CHUAL_011668 [Chamberlinius hualienensis]
MKAFGIILLALVTSLHAIQNKRVEELYGSGVNVEEQYLPIDGYGYVHGSNVEQTIHPIRTFYYPKYYRFEYYH